MEKDKYIQLLEAENKRLENEIIDLKYYKKLFKAAQDKHGICDVIGCLNISCQSDHK